MTTVTQPLTTVQYTEQLRQALARDTALRTLAARATERYAGEAARIDRGLLLALNGHVTLHADGTASVTSGTDAEVVYNVNGHCDCPDASRAPEGRCKHRWAKCLVKRAAACTEEATIDRLCGLCDQVLDDIAAARRLLAASAPRPAVQYFATYTAPDGSEHEGIATQTGQGWLFVAEDGLDPLFASSAALALCGQVDLAEAQLEDDTRVQGSRVLTLLAR